jgi:GWxTD domain-containing protein
MRRICMLAVVAVFAVTPLLAEDLGRFQDWNESPEGYFMTKAEREQWAHVASAGDAEKFVEAFLAKRDAGFPAEVKLRAEQADKYLTIGKVKGSKSLRGKVIVLMGPPSAIHVSSHTMTTTKRDSPAVAGALSNIGPTAGGGGRNGEAGSVSAGTLSTGAEVRIYLMTFEGAEAKAVERTKVSFEIEADAATGDDRFASRDGEKEGRALFELAAKASIKK